MTIALSSMVLGMGLFTGCAAQKEELNTDKFVYEDFKISENKNGQIHGGIIASTENQTGEGIYLDETYHGYDEVKDVEVGDKIRITYNKDDYNNEIWDNIVDAEVIK